MESYQNIGLLFYKHYFKDIDFRFYPENSGSEKANKKLVEESNEAKLKECNEGIYSSKLNKSNIPHISNQLSGFNLETCYPGLFTGSGYMHEASELGELKLGFYFDYTSGLPCIPGSSVKGILHNSFKHWDYIADLIKVLAQSGKFPELTNMKPLKKEEVDKLTDDIFGTQESKESIYKRDLFFDAFPVNTNEDGDFLKNDFITPHKNTRNPAMDAFTNPTPLQFLKVLPQVEFHFNFKLTDSGKLSANIKKALFKQILLDLGIGAKTNVGYGQFELSEEERLAKQEEKTELELKAKLAEIERKIEEKEAGKSEADKRILKGAKLKCKVVKIINNEVFFMFDWDNELEFKKKKSKITVELAEGNVVEIEIIEDFYVKKEVLFNSTITRISQN